MGKINVYLCQVNNKYGNNVFLPYSTGIIISYCLSIDKIRDNFEFKDNLFLKEDINTIVDRLEDPKIFGFSSYIWNAEYNLKLAEKVKLKFPDCLIVFGGHHVPLNSEEFLKKHQHIDLLVHGDGELPFSEILLNYVAGKKDYSNIKNLSINSKGVVFQTEIVKGGADVLKITSPYLSGVFDKTIQSPYSFTASLETNRGCPYQCAYCDWGAATINNKKLDLFDEQRVKDEIEWFGKNKIEFVFGCDSNFGIHPRDAGFVDKFIETKNKYGFPLKFRTAYAKFSTAAIFEMNKKLNVSNMCKGVTLSFQSLNPKTLEAIGRINMRIDNFKELLQKYNDENIPTYTEIIMGLPCETYDTFCNGLSTLLESGQHSSINVYNCVILPNALMGDPKYREYYGIKTATIPASLPHCVPESGTIMEFEQVIVETASMPVADWEEASVFSWAIQCFHCLGLLQYAAIFAHNESKISYIQFYKDLIIFGDNHPGTVIGQAVDSARKIIGAVTKGGGWDVLVKKFGDTTWTIEEASYLNIIDGKESFFDQMRDYLVDYLKDVEKDKVADLVSYSSKMIIDPHCSSSMEVELSYDFQKYFNEFFKGVNDLKLAKIKNRLLFSNITEFHGDLPVYAREIIWYGRKGGRFFHNQNKIKKEYLV